MAIILTLVFSLVEGAFILPAHVGNSKALKELKPNKVEVWMSKFLNGIRDRFYNALKFAIKALDFIFNYSSISRSLFQD